MKARIRQQLEDQRIFVYYFPEEPLAPKDYTTDTKFFVDRSHQPFGVIGSNLVMDGRLRARKYPWGIVDVENPEHSDLQILRDCLMKTNMYNLIDTTNTILYERYRENRLRAGISGEAKGARRSPAKVAALTSDDPIEFMRTEQNLFSRRRDTQFDELELEWQRKVADKEQTLAINKKKLEEYAVENEKRLERQWEELAERTRVFEMEKDKFEVREKQIKSGQVRAAQDKQRWTKQRTSGQSKEYHGNPRVPVPSAGVMDSGDIVQGTDMPRSKTPDPRAVGAMTLKAAVMSSPTAAQATSRRDRHLEDTQGQARRRHTNHPSQNFAKQQPNSNQPDLNRSAGNIIKRHASTKEARSKNKEDMQPKQRTSLLQRLRSRSQEPAFPHRKIYSPLLGN